MVYNNFQPQGKNNHGRGQDFTFPSRFPKGRRFPRPKMFWAKFPVGNWILDPNTPKSQHPNIPTSQHPKEGIRIEPA